MSSDAENQKPPPRWFGFGAALCGLPLFVVGIVLGHPDKGITGALSVGILVLIGRMYWRCRHRPWFWISLAVAAIIHGCVAVFVVHFDKLGRPAIVVFAPFVFGDFIVLAFLFAGLEKGLAAAARNGG